MAEPGEPAKTSEPPDGDASRDGDASADGDTNAEQAPLRYWRDLTSREKWLRAGAMAFVLVHATCVLMTGAPKWFREPVWAAVAWYVDGLRMTNRWGMFSKPPRRETISVIADRREAESYTLTTNIQSTRGLWGRVVDARIRKILGNVNRDENKNIYGAPMLDYYCRIAREAHGDVWRLRVTVEVPETLDDDNAASEKASSEILLSHRCARGRNG